MPHVTHVVLGRATLLQKRQGGLDSRPVLVMTMPSLPLGLDSRLVLVMTMPSLPLLWEKAFFVPHSVMMNRSCSKPASVMTMTMRLLH